jgi:NADH:ubiquinone oxidoreductase subunit 3 (subunit A)
MLSNYLPILIFLIVAAGLAVVLLALGTGIGYYFTRSRNDRAKLSPYECGFEAFEDSRMKFDVRYYLVAILFIVFDLEIAFLLDSSRWACSSASWSWASSTSGRRGRSSGTRGRSLRGLCAARLCHDAGG